MIQGLGNTRFAFIALHCIGGKQLGNFIERIRDIQGLQVEGNEETATTQTTFQETFNSMIEVFRTWKSLLFSHGIIEGCFE